MLMNATIVGLSLLDLGKTNNGRRYWIFKCHRNFTDSLISLVTFISRSERRVHLLSTNGYFRKYGVLLNGIFEDDILYIIFSFSGILFCNYINSVSSSNIVSHE